MNLWFMNCSFRNWIRFLIIYLNPLEKGIIEGENPVYNILIEEHMYLISRVGLFGNAT